MSVVPIDVELRKRPAPPEWLNLSKEEVEIWEAVVDRMPVDWFPAETFPMLGQYCTHTITARRLAEKVARFPEHGTDRDYNRLLIMHERESRIIRTLATSMRLTQQSFYDKTKTKPVKPEEKPWE